MSRYFITWTTYGTWLHGDARGWADKEGYHKGKQADDALLRQRRERQLKHPPITITPKMRVCVETAIREVCEHRGWKLHELNARTNHVHAVVAADATADKVLGDFKAYATRALRKAKLLASDKEVWTEGGDKVFLRGDDAVERCCEYVRNQ
jgi:REP element-mobilizing transposase RayT